jgi:hypothetical protein
MGSTSSGTFKNYPPTATKKGGSGGPQGGGPGGDHCAQELLNVRLEEVGRSAYFQARNAVPNTGIPVNLRTARLGPRLSIDTADGQSIGFLPTEFNYLVVCMKKGFSYSGEVTASSLQPVPSVRINLRPSAP